MDVNESVGLCVYGKVLQERASHPFGPLNMAVSELLPGVCSPGEPFQHTRHSHSFCRPSRKGKDLTLCRIQLSVVF